VKQTAKQSDDRRMSSISSISDAHHHDLIGVPGSTVSVPPVNALRSGQTYRLRRRQSLPLAGADSVIFVRSGMVAAESTVSGSTQTMVELFFPGDVISSELAVAAPGIAHMAMTTAEIVRIDVNSLSHEMGENSALCSYVVHQLSSQRARMQLHIAMLAGLTSEQRVAGLLLQTAHRLGTLVGTSVAFEMPLTRNEVAEYLALNADTLSRIMSRLVRDGIIQRTSRARMAVRDMAALSRLCPASDMIFALHATNNGAAE